MIQPDIRSGICHASVRYARANNKLMGSLYDPQQPTSYIMEVDANNLYGCAISQKMPDGDFEWLSQEECRDMGQHLNYADGCFAIFDTGYSIIGRTKKTKKFYSRGGLGVPAGAARARRRLSASSGGNDDQSTDYR